MHMICATVAHMKEQPETPSRSIQSGNLPFSPRKYVVSDPHEHDTLRLGDLVSVACHEYDMAFYLYRHRDGTLHLLADGSDQYVHVEEYDG